MGKLLQQMKEKHFWQVGIETLLRRIENLSNSRGQFFHKVSISTYCFKFLTAFRPASSKWGRTPTNSRKWSSNKQTKCKGKLSNCFSSILYLYSYCILYTYRLVARDMWGHCERVQAKIFYPPPLPTLIRNFIQKKLS